MNIDYMKMKRTEIQIDASSNEGMYEGWRHSLGYGGINRQPLPEKIIEGMQAFKPRLVRIFLQEYFHVYPQSGVFDWSRLDPYMESIAATGAKILATINLKPPVLFPMRGHAAVQPVNVEEYQEVIYQLVKRYSVDKPYVTHWEHYNEPDIGETGGCPFLLPTAEENYQMYKMLVDPILRAYPEAKVGGPALANVFSPIMEGFINLCHQNNTQLDFVSWHSYCDDPDAYKKMIDHVKSCLTVYGANRPEMMINELNKGFDLIEGAAFYDMLSVEEMANQSRRVAILARVLLTLEDTDLDWSHYYHGWDGPIEPDDFRLFFTEEGMREVMYKHWNEFPTRFGMFSPNCSVRPQYFVYRILSQMEGIKRKAVCSDESVTVRTVEGDTKISVLLVNHHPEAGTDTVVKLCFTGLRPGYKSLKVYRIDDERRWDDTRLELIPVEERDVYVLEDLSFQCYAPQDSVVWLVLEDQ